MTKPKLRIDVYFHNKDQQDLFLFQVLNVGKETDELKFIFNDHKSGMGIFYTEAEQKLCRDGLVRLQAEISYHSDGTMLIKLPQYSERTSTIYRNPSGEGYRRTPLARIFEWEPFVKYTVVDYSICKRKQTERALVVPQHDRLFDGTPFECILFLGNKVMPSPRQTQERCVFRLNNVARELDLLCCFYKTEYRGEYIELPNTGQRIWMVRNIVQAVIRNTERN